MVWLLYGGSTVNLLGGSIGLIQYNDDMLLTHGAKRKDKPTVVCLFMSGIMGSTLP